MKIKEGLLCFLLVLLFIQVAYADTWHFDGTLTIPDGNKWHFGDNWVSTSGTAMHIQEWFVDNWVNYTIDFSGIQEIYFGSVSAEMRAYIDGSVSNATSGWSYTSGIVTVTSAHISVSIHYDVIQVIPIGPGQSGGITYSFGLSLVNYGRNVINAMVYLNNLLRTTDSEGNLVFYGLVSGNYTLKVIVNGIVKMKTSVTIDRNMNLKIDIGTGKIIPDVPSWVEKYVALIAFSIFLVIVLVIVLVARKLKGREKNWIKS